MDHTPVVIEVKQVNNEYVGYRIVCCGLACDVNQPDAKCTPSHHVCEDSWHTAHITGVDDHEAWVADRLAEVAARHQTMTDLLNNTLASPTMALAAMDTISASTAQIAQVAVVQAAALASRTAAPVGPSTT